MKALDPRNVLAIPKIFDWFNRIIGSANYRRFCVENFIQPRAGDAILDLGCGTAEIADYLPTDIRYTGVDSEAKYIEACRKRFGDKYEFILNATWDPAVIPAGPYDRVLAFGVLHHLDDSQAEQLIRLARRLLRPGGFFVTYDGCRLPNESFVEKCLLNMDRGRHIRTSEAYVRIASGAFSRVDAQLHRHLLRIPYPHFFMRCS